MEQINDHEEQSEHEHAYATAVALTTVAMVIADLTFDADQIGKRLMAARDGAAHFLDQLPAEDVESIAGVEPRAVHAKQLARAIANELCWDPWITYERAENLPRNEPDLEPPPFDEDEGE